MAFSASRFDTGRISGAVNRDAHRILVSHQFASLQKQIQIDAYIIISQTEAFMKEEKIIIEDYKRADFHDRVMLFLAHRDLRDEFMDIEYRLAGGEKKSNRSGNV
jgi:hypothetical protein